MKLNSLKFPVTNVSVANTHAMNAPVTRAVPQSKPFATGLKPASATPVKALASSMLPRPVGPGAGDDRRRGQRVLLKVRANIHVAVHGKSTTLEATTLSVNNGGALIVLPQSLPVETRLVLEHSMTRERVPCRVARLAREMPEGFHIPIEFDSPAPDFWKIAFPPADWRPFEES